MGKRLSMFYFEAKAARFPVPTASAVVQLESFLDAEGRQWFEPPPTLTHPISWTSASGSQLREGK